MKVLKIRGVPEFRELQYLPVWVGMMEVDREEACQPRSRSLHTVQESVVQRALSVLTLLQVAMVAAVVHFTRAGVI